MSDNSVSETDLLRFDKVPNRRDLLPLVRLFMQQGSDKDALIKFLEVHKKHVNYWPASIKYHHCWVGGWADHTAQVVKFGIHLFRLLEHTGDLGFNINDVIIACIGHDFDKLTRYQELDEANKWRAQPKYGSQRWMYSTSRQEQNLRSESVAIAGLFRIGVNLTDLHIEAIDHCEGGFAGDVSSVFSKGIGGMTKLSTLVQAADTMSGFIYGNMEPKSQDLFPKKPKESPQGS